MNSKNTSQAPRCSKDNHIWIFNTEEQKEPFDWQACYCGKMEWSKRKQAPSEGKTLDLELEDILDEFRDRPIDFENARSNYLRARLRAVIKIKRLFNL